MCHACDEEVAIVQGHQAVEVLAGVGRHRGDGSTLVERRPVRCVFHRVHEGVEAAGEHQAVFLTVVAGGPESLFGHGAC